MGTIGIVVNPNSGKDIRRLVTHATMIDNLEKVNILCRIIMGIGSLGGNHDIYIIPDRFRLGRAAMRDLQDTEEVKRVQILDMVYFDQQDDTTKFTEIMVNEKKADVMIVMGGDGTSRAVAKAIGDVPLIAVSTGLVAAAAIVVPSANAAETPTTFSSAELNSVSGSVLKADIPGTAWAVDSKSNRVLVTVDSTVSQAEIDKIKRQAGDDPALFGQAHPPGPVWVHPPEVALGGEKEKSLSVRGPGVERGELP